MTLAIIIAFAILACAALAVGLREAERDRAPRAALWLAVAVMAAALSLALTVSPARAHGPWEALCCSDRDCVEVDSKHIREDGEEVHVLLPPGSHPMWPADGRTAFVGKVNRSQLRRAVTGEWGVCISPSGTLLCVYPPAVGG